MGKPCLKYGHPGKEMETIIKKRGVGRGGAGTEGGDKRERDGRKTGEGRGGRWGMGYGREKTGRRSAKR